MTNCKSIYEPREDSTLLEQYVRKYARGSVLDMGTGSGIQAIAAAHSSKVDSVLGVDVQKFVIDYCKKNIKNRKIKFMVSDLFSLVPNKKFSTIIFNPPYLPDELKVKDLTLEGGKRGYEVIERFLNDVGGYLEGNGDILLIFSSLTKKEKVDEFIKNKLLEFELLEKEHQFFEDIYAYRIFKSEILKGLEKKGIQKIKYFSKGKRGYIFLGTYKNKKVGIKIKNPKSKAISRIYNEVKTLKLLNKKGIGPKLLFSDIDYMVYYFVPGIYFDQYLIKNKKIKIIKLIKDIYRQLFEIDKMKLNKEEMSHPDKHIIIDKDKPVLIDFERARYTLKPGNVTQFCDYLISGKVSRILNSKNIKINKAELLNKAKIYKKRQNLKNFNNIIKIIK